MMIANERGVGLLEVLIAMILVSIGLLGMGMMLGVSMDGNTMSRSNTIAASLIKEQIEYYEGLDSIPGAPFKLAEEGLQRHFTRTTAVMDNTIDTTMPDGLYHVAVQVGWTDYESQDHTRTFETYIYKTN
jgi:Tfp pilus assembly protein PilV